MMQMIIISMVMTPTIIIMIVMIMVIQVEIHHPFSIWYFILVFTFSSKDQMHLCGNTILCNWFLPPNKSGIVLPIDARAGFAAAVSKWKSN